MMPHPLEVLFGRQACGMSPEEETTHARWWLVLVLFAGALGYLAGGA